MVISPLAPVAQVEQTYDCEGDQRGEEPVPFRRSLWILEFTVEVGLLCWPRFGLGRYLGAFLWHSICFSGSQHRTRRRPCILCANSNLNPSRSIQTRPAEHAFCAHSTTSEFSSSTESIYRAACRRIGLRSARILRKPVSGHEGWRFMLPFVTHWRRRGGL
jgi:hypothetical protein